MAICTFDIETLGWDYPLAVGFYNGNGHYWDFLRKSDSDDVIWRFLQWLGETFPGAIVYGHYARNFDNKFLLESLISHGQTIGVQMGLGSLKWEEGKIRFIDSNLLLKLSLDKACKAFGIEQKLQWNHNRTKPIWEMGSKDLYSFRAYLERDCRSLSAVYQRFVWELVNQFSISEPSSTLATTALKIFEVIQEVNGGRGLEDIDSNVGAHSYIRQALYGGRNEIYNRYGEGVTLYDIRSMYVSCYDTPVPIGRMTWVGKPRIEKGTLAEAEVWVPEDWFIGPLPYHRNGLLLFPVGKFRGWWDMVELRYAVEIGCKVRLIRQLETQEEPVLQSFGKLLLNLRKQASTPELSTLWKILGIQLIGKLAQGRERTVVLHRDKIPNKDGWEPIDRSFTYFEGVMSVNGRQKRHLEKVTKPALTMRVRAEARVRHHRRLMEGLQKGELFYGDTDSVYTSAELETGPNPGQLQIVDRAARAYFIMRKFYGYVTPEGIIHQRSSGFSGYKLSEEEFKYVLEGGSVLKENGRPTLTGLVDIIGQKNGKLKAQLIPRTIRTPFTQQNRVIEGWNTKPIRIGD